MAQAKKKQATRTAKKTTARKAKSCAARKTCAKKQVSSADRMHVYIITAMGMIAGILLCADVAMMIV